MPGSSTTSNSPRGDNRPSDSGSTGGARPASAMRETTHVKVATRSAKERNVRTTIDLKRPWYYSA